MTALGNIPCNGCRACCLHDMIPLMPERDDLIWTYEHEVIATAAGPTAVLQCGETGECIYLGRDGCTIHDRAPSICRAFDCREMFLSKTRAPSAWR
jgi:Fe-S-cluster containining protein